MEQWHRLFPFFILLNEQMELIAYGKQLEKMIPGAVGKPFASLFSIQHPDLKEWGFLDIQNKLNEEFHLTSKSSELSHTLNLIGQFEWMEANKNLMFIGRPHFVSMQDVLDHQIGLNDFAKFDITIELLQVKAAIEIQEKENNQLKAQIQAERDQFKNFSLITEGTVNGGVVTDAAGKILWVNNAFQKITGYTLGEIKGKTPGSFLQGKETDSNTVKYMRECIKGGKNFDCEIVNYNKQQQPYWIKISGQPIFNEQGEVMQFFALEEDITERIVAAEKLRQSEERWKFALEGSGEGVWEYNIQTQVSFFSSHYEKMLGYTKSALEQDKEVWEMLLHPDDYHIIQDYVQSYTIGLISNHHEEYRLKCKDGRYIWVLDRGMLMSKTGEGKPLSIIGTHTDITELKASELLLEKSEKKFRSLSENIPGVVYEFAFRNDGDHGFKFISPTIEKIFGITADDFFQFSRFVHPDDAMALMQAINDSAETNLPFYYEGRLKIDGRSDAWYSASASFSYRENDGTRIYTGILINITEKKLADQKLDEQRDFYEKVMNQIPSDIAVFDKNHRYLFLNPIAVKDPELRHWMIGKDDEAYCLHRNKPKEIMEGRRAIFNEVLTTKKLVEWEETLVGENGTKEYHLRKMYPVLDEQGMVSMVIGYGVNITERKEIEEQMRVNEKRYRDLFNYSQALICTHDIQGNLLSVNPAICALLGYSKNEMIGKSLVEFLPQKDEEKFNEEYLNIVKNEGKSKGVFRVVHKNGKKLFLLYQNYKVEENGVEPYVIGFSQDITDRIQAENDLLLAKQITENVSKAKEIFLANMSHEIRTPMNGILGVANLLAKTALADQQKNYLKLIKESANNLLLIVNDVLEIEKIASGKIEFEQIPFRFEEKIYTAIQSYQYKVEEKGLQLIFHSFLKKDLVVLGDPYRLSQVINNLLNNALKFTNDGKISINLNELKQSGETILIELAISDTGIGIDTNKLDTIFEPFMQAATDTTRKFGGTGLGLSICKNLVEMQGGNIQVNSQLDVGTTFTIQLPYKIGSLDLLDENEKAPPDYSAIGKKRILIAEDVALNQFIASQILESWGMDVAVADNGKIAVEMVQEAAFDLILMDIQMPEMDGIEATEIIRKMEDPILSAIPIIALTANALKGDNHRYFQVGMNDYITKPYTEEKLFSVISKFLSAKSSHAVNTNIQQPEKSNVPQPEKPNIQQPEKSNVPQPEKPNIVKAIKIESGENAVDEPVLYDLTMVNQIGKGNPIFIKKMVSLFLHQMPIDIESLKMAAAQLDWPLVALVAHKMKPTIDGMGLYSLKDKIRELESMSRKDKMLNDAEMNSLIVEVSNIMNKAIVQMEIEFPNETII